MAQKVYIRNCNRYSSGVLLEVNSHSLFSKWFSESGDVLFKLKRERERVRVRVRVRVREMERKRERVRETVRVRARVRERERE